MDSKLPEPMRTLLRQKLVDSWEQPLPQLTRRDTWIPRIPGKTPAVIGIRRSGKTSLRALLEAMEEPSGQGAQPRLISLEQRRPHSAWPESVAWSNAVEWLLES